jgi:hypothetical protein
MIKNKHYEASFTVLGNTFSHRISANWETERKAIVDFNRMFYFFSENNIDVRNLFHADDFTLNIQEVAGRSKIFQKFSFSMSNNTAMRENSKVILFLENERVGSLFLTIGIAKDGNLNLKNLPISVTKYNKIYVPQEDFINSDPLPAMWMELFSEEYRPKVDDYDEALDSTEELIMAYTPRVNEHEVLSSPLGSSKVMHLNVDLNPAGSVTSVSVMSRPPLYESPMRTSPDEFMSLYSRPKSKKMRKSATAKALPGVRSPTAGSLATGITTPTTVISARASLATLSGHQSFRSNQESGA